MDKVFFYNPFYKGYDSVKRYCLIFEDNTYYIVYKDGTVHKNHVTSNDRFNKMISDGVLLEDIAEGYRKLNIDNVLAINYLIKEV